MNNEKQPCSRCSATGRIPCPACSGAGKSEQFNEGFGKKEKRIVSCAGCHGTGERVCGVCGGSGKK